MKFLCLLILCFFFGISCAEDRGGTRRFDNGQAEEPEETEDEPGTVRVKCFSTEAENDIIYLIRASNGRFDYANCVLSEDNCEDERIQLVQSSMGEGNETRPCLNRPGNPEEFKICLSTRDDLPENPLLVRMTGYEFEMIFDFFCEETINDIIR